MNRKIATVCKFASSYPNSFNLFVGMMRLSRIVKVASILSDFDSFIKEGLDARDIDYKSTDNFGRVLESVARHYDSYVMSSEDLIGEVLLRYFADPKVLEAEIYSKYNPHRSSFKNFLWSVLDSRMKNLLRTINRERKKFNDDPVPYANSEGDIKDDFTFFADNVSAKEFEYFHDTALELEADNLLDEFREYTKTLKPKFFDPKIMDMLDIILDEGKEGNKVLGIDLSERLNVTAATISRWYNKLQNTMKDFARQNDFDVLENTLDVIDRSIEKDKFKRKQEKSSSYIEVKGVRIN